MYSTIIVEIREELSSFTKFFATVMMKSLGLVGLGENRVENCRSRSFSYRGLVSGPRERDGAATELESIRLPT